MTDPFIIYVKNHYNEAPTTLRSKEKIHWLRNQFDGGGLTMSKAYLDSWVLPVSVHVCKIDRIVPNLYQNFLRLYGLREYDKPPKQMYYYGNGANVPRKALQLPYRIILNSADNRGETWYIENESEFTTLCKMFLNARGNPNDVGVVNSIIEQQPV